MNQCVAKSLCVFNVSLIVFCFYLFVSMYTYARMDIVENLFVFVGLILRRCDDQQMIIGWLISIDIELITPAQWKAAKIS